MSASSARRSQAAPSFIRPRRYQKRPRMLDRRSATCSVRSASSAHWSAARRSAPARSRAADALASPGPSSDSTSRPATSSQYRACREPGGVDVSSRSEFVGREVPDRAQQVVAVFVVGLDATDEAPVDESAEDLQVVPGVTDAHRGVPRDSLDAAEVEVAGEDREALQHRPFVRFDQLVAPGDGVPKRSLSFRRVDRRPAGQRHRSFKPVEDRGRRQESHRGRGELDGQRKAVESRDDRADRDDIRVREPEARGHGLRALQEELDGG